MAPTTRYVHLAFTRTIAPLLFIALFAISGLAVIGRVTITSRSATGALCPDRPLHELQPLAAGQTRLVEGLFATDRICWPTNVRIERGGRYRIQLVERDPWFDKSVISGIAGFPTRTFRQALALPLRRNPDADWLQPIARVGRRDGAEFAIRYDGGAEFPLAAWNGTDARGDVQAWLGRDLPSKVSRQTQAGGHGPDRACLMDLPWISDKLPGDALAYAETFHRALERLPRRHTAEFVSKADGELFLFVNDAIFGLPYLDLCNWFYDNNRGTASVSVMRLEEPMTVQ